MASWPFFRIATTFFGVAICSLFFLFPKSLLAATRTWDGGGSDGTCGGNAGDGNKWSCNANWSSDTKPVSGDIVTFDGTSTKDATIDQAFTIATLNINAGYTGTITQSADLTLNSFVHNTTDGRFVGSSGTFTVVGGTLSFDVDSGDDTFGIFTINKSSGSVVSGVSGDTITVTGLLTLTEGNLGTATLNAQDGVVPGASFDGGTGTITITGASARTINLTAGGQLPAVTLDAANVTINGPSSGTATFDGLFTVSSGTYTGAAGDLTLSGGLTVSSGLFSGGSGAIDVNGAFTLSGVSTVFTSTSGTLFVSGGWTHTQTAVSLTIIVER